MGTFPIPVLIIFGPTASGKTSVVERLFSANAQSFYAGKAEIISADSMQVYKGLDIGTAKPDTDLLKKLPNHLIDMCSPSEQFGTGEFVRHADEAFAADEFCVGVVGLVFGKLSIDEALCDVIDDAVLEGAVTLQPPRVFIVPHADGLCVSCLVLGVGIPAGDIDVVHAAVVEGGSFVFVSLAWR